ncbi:hypothetical protein DRQ16_01135 [bacterium]|nr:MAG: hypothetical protein DRQ16_01135 [bacterium]
MRYLYLSLLFFLGCDYYNIYYNARDAFERAMEEKEKTGKVNQSLLKRAEEKCSKLLQFYPRSRWVGGALLMRGRIYLELEDYPKAKRKFTELITYFPESKLVDDAYLYLGIAYLRTGDYEYAIYYLKRAIEKGDKRVKEEAITELLFVYLERGEVERVIEEGERISDEFPGVREKIYLVLARAKAKLKDKEKAMEYYERLLSLSLPPGEEKKIRIEYAWFLYEMKEYEKAQEVIESIDDPEVMLIKGLSMLALGDEEGVSFLEDAARKGGKIAIRAFYELGRYYEDRANWEKAKEYYTRATQGPGNVEEKKLARKRKEAIERIKKYAEEEDEAKRHFFTAETYLFDLGKPDLAEIEYETIWREYPDSPYVVKSLFALGYINELKGDITKAKEFYRLIMRKYPDYAAQAKRRLDEIEGRESKEE